MFYLILFEIPTEEGVVEKKVGMNFCVGNATSSGGMKRHNQPVTLLHAAIIHITCLPHRTHDSELSQTPISLDQRRYATTE